MPLPLRWSLVPVYGTYTRLDGTPAVGSVWFESSSPVILPGDDNTAQYVVPRKIEAVLDAQGHFEVLLPSTNDPDINPKGWTYQVTESFSGGRKFSIDVPYANAPIDLVTWAQATPIPAPPLQYSYLTTADIGHNVASQTAMAAAQAQAQAAADASAEAVETANTAAAQVAGAVAASDAATETANTALANVSGAIEASNAATEASGQAVNTANAAAGVASEAATTANNAATDAAEALSTANGIDAKATQAQSDAAVAVDTANSAAAVAEDANTTAEAAETSAAAAQSLASGLQAQIDLRSPVGSFKNKIINGNFDVWQRGVSLSAAAMSQKYLADRWVEWAAGSTIAPSRQAFAAGQTDVPGNPTYFHRAVVASVAGANNYVLNQQRIEGVGTLAGKLVTLSFWAKANAAKSLGISFDQTFGVGGSPSAPVSGIGATKVQLDTFWKKFTVSTVIPSIAGKVLGTSDDGLRINLWYDAGTNGNVNAGNIGQQSGTFDIAQVQLEAGEVATSFEQRPIGVELPLCLRYFEDLNYSNALQWGIAFGFMLDSTTFHGQIVYTPKRAAPAITASNVAATIRTAAGLAAANVSFSLMNGSRTYISAPLTVGSIAAGTACYIRYDDGSHIYLDAEL